MLVVGGGSCGLQVDGGWAGCVLSATLQVPDGNRVIYVTVGAGGYGENDCAGKPSSFADKKIIACGGTTSSGGSSGGRSGWAGLTQNFIKAGFTGGHGGKPLTKYGSPVGGGGGVLYNKKGPRGGDGSSGYRASGGRGFGAGGGTGRKFGSYFGGAGAPGLVVVMWSPKYI